MLIIVRYHLICVYPLYAQSVQSSIITLESRPPLSTSLLLFLPYPIPCSAISLTSLKRISYLIMAYLCYNLLYGIGQHSINFGCPLPQCVWQPCDVSVQPDVNDPSRKRNSPRKTERQRERWEGRAAGGVAVRGGESGREGNSAAGGNSAISYARSFFSHGR